MLVVDCVLLVVDIRRLANLMAVNAAPAQQLAVCSGSNRVVAATIDRLDVLAGEGLNNLGVEHHGIILASVVNVASLRVVVQTERPHATVVVLVEAVVRAGGDINSMLLHSELATGFGLETTAGTAVTGDGLTAELELATASPAEDLAGLVKSQNVVGTGGKLGDVLKTRDQDGRSLDSDTLSEANDALSATEGSPSVHETVCSEDKRRRVSSNNLDKDSIRSDLLAEVDLTGGALVGVDARVIIVVIRVLVVHVTHAALPGSVATKGTVVIDTPSEDLVVVGEDRDVHTTRGDLDDANLGGIEVVVETRALHVNGLLAVVLLATKAKLARGALAKDKDVESLGRGLIDGGTGGPDGGDSLELLDGARGSGLGLGLLDVALVGLLALVAGLLGLGGLLLSLFGLVLLCLGLDAVCLGRAVDGRLGSGLLGSRRLLRGGGLGGSLLHGRGLLGRLLLTHGIVIGLGRSLLLRANGLRCGRRLLGGSDGLGRASLGRGLGDLDRGRGSFARRHRDVVSLCGVRQQQTECLARLVGSNRGSRRLQRAQKPRDLSWGCGFTGSGKEVDARADADERVWVAQWTCSYVYLE
jgi:hypothetical protein